MVHDRAFVFIGVLFNNASWSLNEMKNGPFHADRPPPRTASDGRILQKALQTQKYFSTREWIKKELRTLKPRDVQVGTGAVWPCKGPNLLSRGLMPLPKSTFHTVFQFSIYNGS
jgi:hypothetical protein